MSDFDAGVALVLGGSGGVGSAIVAQLAAAGTDVAATYRNNRAGAEAAADAARAHGRTATTHALDLSDSEATAALLTELASRFGAIHSVIHAVGPRIDQPYLSQVSPEQWTTAVHADLDGFFHVVRAAIPHLRASQGTLVAITSAGVHRTPVGDVLSVAPKAAVEALVRTVAKEEGRFGVRANNVALGVIEAGMFLDLREREFDQSWIDAATRNTPLRRFGTADEVAHVAVFLASRRSSYVTGQTIRVDGGYAV